jgi:hypothetical protein
LFETTLSITDQRGGCKDRSGAIHGAKRQGGEAIRFGRERPMTFPDHFSGHADRYGDFPPPTIRSCGDSMPMSRNLYGCTRSGTSKGGYRSLRFPFKEVTPPRFRLVQKWDRHRLAARLGTWYLSTWSLSKRYWTLVGAVPINVIRAHLEATRGAPSQVGQVVLPLHLRVGMITERSPDLGWRGP